VHLPKPRIGLAQKPLGQIGFGLKGADPCLDGGKMSVLARLRSAFLAASLALMGCDAVPTAQNLHELSVLDGAITVAAPKGYCIDKDASVSRGAATVFLIGRCNDQGQVAAAVVTLTIGGPASAGVLAAGPQALGEFFASEAGRKVLARDGDQDHVKIVQMQSDGRGLLLHLNDDVAGDYWRAITGIKGRLVTISASGVAGATLTPAQARILVTDTMALLDKRNGVKPPAS
jgi:hypothetical protein